MLAILIDNSHLGEHASSILYPEDEDSRLVEIPYLSTKLYCIKPERDRDKYSY
jgi:hypothetical protein